MISAADAVSIFEHDDRCSALDRSLAGRVHLGLRQARSHTGQYLAPIEEQAARIERLIELAARIATEVEYVRGGAPIAQALQRVPDFLGRRLVDSKERHISDTSEHQGIWH